MRHLIPNKFILPAADTCPMSSGNTRPLMVLSNTKKKGNFAANHNKKLKIKNQVTCSKVQLKQIWIIHWFLHLMH